MPHKFEAGTPAILEAIGLSAAIDYVEAIGYDAIAAHEAALTDHALARLSDDRGPHDARPRAGSRRRGLASPWTARTRMTWRRLLDRQGIAVRAGHHCAEPLMQPSRRRTARARASSASTRRASEIDALAEALVRVREFFA